MLNLFLKGGPMMWPLLATSLVALTTIFERLISWWRERRSRRPSDVRSMMLELRKGDHAAAIGIGEPSTDFVARCLAFALKGRESDFASSFQQHAARELERAGRGLAILDTTITIAPLLGLLGTVTGMIHAFGLMGASELSAPTAITGGIAQALIATAFGLGIAITSLIPFNWLGARVEKIRFELQSIGSHAEAVLEKSREEEASASHRHSTGIRYEPVGSRT
jgi:biopolymer transport protein ExbB